MNANISYREAAAQGASPVRLVICLYEQAIEDLHRALVALHHKDIGERTRSVNHAITVIGYLQSTLNMEHGGAVAKNLEHFYNVIRARLIDAQCMQSAAIVEQQISLLMQVHEAWLEVERASSAASAEDKGQTMAPLATPPSTAFTDWSA